MKYFLGEQKLTFAHVTILTQRFKIENLTNKLSKLIANIFWKKN
jgi:hypothetical protein